MVLAAVGLWLLWGGGQLAPWMLAGALTSAVIAVTRPRLLAWPNRLWNGFGQVAGRITNPLLLGLVFLVLITPGAILMRAFRRDPLGLRPQPRSSTYWTPTPTSEEPLQASMRRQF